MGNGKKKILVVGSGGREHALCWKIAQSRLCGKLYCAPGNDGMSKIAQLVNIKADDIDGLLNFAKANRIDLIVVGPEIPLVKGIVDAFEKEGLKAFGPNKELANIEGSKVFAKELMSRFGVPTADFRVFDDFNEALKYSETNVLPMVIKADGLCAGKGVIIAKTRQGAEDALKKIMVDRVFQDSGNRVVIEECLVGEEASIIVISDGETIVPLASSQDHKRVFDSDKGPNTGGMGAYSPAPIITDQLFKKISDTVMMPIIKGLADEGKPYKGALYAGIMVTEKGPFVLEFNARFGDPETQAIMPRLKSDLVEAMERAIDGKLSGYSLEWDKRPCVSVVLASGGYPGDYENGLEIKGLDAASGIKDVVVFHAATKLGCRAADGKNLFITSGGRVLNVTALGVDMEKAIDNCYKAVRLISFDRMHYRKDIAYKAVKERTGR